ncbi:hypothetical protein MW887_007201 [Aspergillus wentii]|nr:hypothetical protein MW887_007201 [Aspergillus wentii]
MAPEPIVQHWLHSISGREEFSEGTNIPYKRRRLISESPYLPWISPAPSQLGYKLDYIPELDEGKDCSPAAIKRGLSDGGVKVLYISESDGLPHSADACELLSFLTREDGGTMEHMDGDTDAIKTVTEAACKFEAEGRGKGSWVIEVAYPMMQLAVKGTNLESWSVQGETAHADYAHWEGQYEQYANQGYGLFETFSHVDGKYGHSSKRLLGPGVKVTDSCNGFEMSEVDLGVWMGGLIRWGFENRRGVDTPPPVVGCIMTGRRWEFYIIYGLAERWMPEDPGEPDTVLGEVHVYGPLGDLTGWTDTEDTTASLLETLRRVMEYTGSSYANLLFDTILK